MVDFDTKTRKIGNSLGITIPKQIVEKEGFDPREEVRVVIVSKKRYNLKRIFGTLKLKKPTQEIIDEIDEEFR